MKLLMASHHQLWPLSYEQQIMEPKQLHAELHPFGENYHVNLN